MFVALPPDWERKRKKSGIRLKSFENVVKFDYIGEGNKSKLHSRRSYELCEFRI
jgi:hypothetical protein